MSWGGGRGLWREEPLEEEMSEGGRKEGRGKRERGSKRENRDQRDSER